ncbi:MAG: dipeptidase [Chitinophagales bacterium]
MKNNADVAAEAPGNAPAWPGVDGHCDTLWGIVERGGRLRDPQPGLQIDLPRLRAGGVDLQVFACCPFSTRPWIALNGRVGARGVAAMFDRLLSEAEAPDAAVKLIKTRADVEELADWVEAGRPDGRPRVSALLALEGGEGLEGDLLWLRTFHRLGLRLLTLTHSDPNELADGVNLGDKARGLTPFGRAVVSECRRLGIVIDVAHLAPAGFWEVLDLARDAAVGGDDGPPFPVVASHAGAKAVFDHPRNLTDDQARAIAATGGLVGVCFVPQFLNADAPKACLEDALDHLDHFVRLVGPDHVGLGSDFDGVDFPVKGLESPAGRPGLVAGLKRRGYGDEVIGKVMGRNWLRVLAAVLP